MSSLKEAYDQNLLDEAPAATRAQRQEGYNVDLLDDRPTRPASTQPLKPPPIIAHDTDVESSSLTGEKVVSGVAAHPTQSFWRSRNGKIVMFIIAIVVVGAVVGGAVGGTAGKISSNNSAAPSQNAPSESNSTSSTTSTTSPPVTGGVAPNPSSTSSDTLSAGPDTATTTCSPRLGITCG